MSWQFVFGYDIWANLLSASVTQGSAPMLSVSVNMKNQINNTGFVYDAAGNRVAEPGRSYSYNAENQLVATAGVRYSYHGDGRRVAKSSGNPSQPYKLYWYGMSSLDALVETDGSNNNPVRCDCRWEAEPGWMLDVLLQANTAGSDSGFSMLRSTTDPLWTIRAAGGNATEHSFFLSAAAGTGSGKRMAWRY